MPEKSAITFLIFAWVIISCPFRMPPSSSPMITSTIAISTSVKPCCLFFIANLPWTRPGESLPATSVPRKNGSKRRPEHQLTRQRRRVPDNYVGPSTRSTFSPLERYAPPARRAAAWESGLGGIADGPFCQQPPDHELRP